MITTMPTPDNLPADDREAITEQLEKATTALRAAETMLDDRLYEERHELGTATQLVRELYLEFEAAADEEDEL